ncbi:MAG: alpha/beta fold hydrolase [Pseudomonadota bacterium]
MLKIAIGLVVIVASLLIASTIISGNAIRHRLEMISADARTFVRDGQQIEYAVEGAGPPVLVIHGAGGGFDQGLLIGRELTGDGFQIIAVSRFGYLGSDLPDDASTPAQADAFAALLEELSLSRVHVLAFSGGAPPALQFAERYPDRLVSMAILSPAPFTPFGPDVEDRPIPSWVYSALFGNDAVYWVLSKLARASLLNAFDARAELRDNLSAREAAFVDALVDTFLPASRRVRGVLNEGAAVDPATTYKLDAITAPVFVAHARDDRLNPVAVSLALSQGIDGSDVTLFDTGGHLLLGHHEALRNRISWFYSAAASTGSESGGR